MLHITEKTGWYSFGSNERANFSHSATLLLRATPWLVSRNVMATTFRLPAAPNPCRRIQGLARGSKLWNIHPSCGSDAGPEEFSTWRIGLIAAGKVLSKVGFDLPGLFARGRQNSNAGIHDRNR